jgi:hypothetical protein
MSYENKKPREETMIFENGDIFIGILKDGKSFTGKGIETLSSGIKFGGTFENGLYLKGKLTFPDGKIFKGTFKDGLQFEGETTYSDGRIFKGTFKDGRTHKGKLTQMESHLMELLKMMTLIKGYSHFQLERHMI